MKELAADLSDFDRVEGNYWISAWQTSEGTCRVQIRNPRMTKALPKLVECERVGTGVKGGYLAIFAVRRTLNWVARNVIDPITLEFAKEFEGSKTQIDPCRRFPARSTSNLPEAA